MAASLQPEIRFRVDREERAKAEQVAARIGMNLNEAMKVMFKRFIVEGGLPFDMRRLPAENERGSGEGSMPVFGVSTEVLAEVASRAAREAAEAHLRAGRLPASNEAEAGRGIRAR